MLTFCFAVQNVIQMVPWRRWQSSWSLLVNWTPVNWPSTTPRVVQFPVMTDLHSLSFQSTPVEPPERYTDITITYSPHIFPYLGATLTKLNFLSFWPTHCFMKTRSLYQSQWLASMILITSEFYNAYLQTLCCHYQNARMTLTLIY